MSQFVLKAPVRAAALEEGQGALSRETLQATGFYMGRVVIATAEFAPMPPLHFRATPAVSFRWPSGCVFGGMTESIGPMWSKTKNQVLGTGPYRLPPVGPAPRQKNASGGPRSSHRPR